MIQKREKEKERETSRKTFPELKLANITITCHPNLVGFYAFMLSDCIAECNHDLC